MAVCDSFRRTAPSERQTVNGVNAILSKSSISSNTKKEWNYQSIGSPHRGRIDFIGAAHRSLHKLHRDPMFLFLLDITSQLNDELKIVWEKRGESESFWRSPLSYSLPSSGSSAWRSTAFYIRHLVRISKIELRNQRAIIWFIFISI